MDKLYIEASREEDDFRYIYSIDIISLYNYLCIIFGKEDYVHNWNGSSGEEHLIGWCDDLKTHNSITLRSDVFEKERENISILFDIVELSVDNSPIDFDKFIEFCKMLDSKEGL